MFVLLDAGLLELTVPLDTASDRKCKVTGRAGEATEKKIQNRFSPFFQKHSVQRISKETNKSSIHLTFADVNAAAVAPALSQLQRRQHN